MKKSIFTIAFTIAFTIISLNSYAGRSNKLKVADYVVTNEGITYVDQLRVDADHNLTAKTESGEIMMSTGVPSAK